MKKNIQISDSELKIMKTLWVKHPLASSEIIDKLTKTTDWKPATIKTLIRRLVKKDLVDYNDNNRTYYYYPLIEKDEFIRHESKSFLRKVYDGGIKAMFANFIEMGDLSKEDIKELKSILDEKEE